MKEKTFQTDHHNQVLPIRRDFWMKQNKSPNIIVLHIDQHSDLATPPSRIEQAYIYDAAYIYDYAVNTCNIGNFIKPALEAGIISQCIQLRTETSLLEFDINSVIHDSSFIILDIDIDFRAPEMNNNHMDATFQKTKDLISMADLVTIATSPGFIDQDLAQVYIQRLLS
jgi:arginase family enzyme